MEKDIFVIKKFSEQFPVLLENIYNPPEQLFWRGTALGNEDKIGIVGMRKCSREGIEIAKKITDQCVKKGLTIVSGLANGIDSAVHEQAIASRGKTIAVLPCGLKAVRQNYQLMQKILAAGGTAISEYEPEAEARKFTFLERNRIISGLCKGIIVIEADFKSGALNTASHALKQNRMTWAVPGNIDRIQSRGTNNLIKKNEASLLTGVEDLKDIFQFSGGAAASTQLNLSLEERLITKLLDQENLSTAELEKKTGIDYGELILLLTNLELEKIIFQNFLNKWQKLT